MIVNTISQRIGAAYDATASTFTVWAPFRRQVDLILQPPFSADPVSPAIHPMEKEETGYWKIRLPAAPGTKYWYRLDGTAAYPDPASFSQPEGVQGPSELVDSKDFSWNDDGWKGLPLCNMIIYEIHTGSFSNSHDFEGILQRLDYFVELGINALELMPLGQFPGDRNWGYDGVFPFAVHSSYGGMREFQKLVNAAHAKGIAILVDVVYNHFGPEGNHLAHYGPYFTDKYHTPWGNAINFDDAWSDGVRNYFLQNARMWLEDYHVDGLRLDAVHAIKDLSASHFILQLKEEALEIERKTGRKKELIAEIDLNDPRYINPPEKGGYGLDGQWIDEFHHALHSLLTGERNAYYEDFGEMDHLEKAFRNTYVYNGIYSPHRKRTFGGKADNNPYSQFVVFAQNHDQIGNRATGDRLTATLSLEQLKLAAATVLLSPYTPLLFMGEEYGEKNPFPFFVSFTDPALVEVVQKGRKAEFPGFAADREIPDPQAEATFQQAILSWNYHDHFHSTLYQFYRFLIVFRKTRPAMQGRTRDSMIVYPAKEKTLCLERKIFTDQIIIYLNFSGQESLHNNLQDSTLHKLFDSASEEWSGPASAALTEIGPGGLITLSPYSALVFEKNNK